MKSEGFIKDFLYAIGPSINPFMSEKWIKREIALDKQITSNLRQRNKRAQDCYASFIALIPKRFIANNSPRIKPIRPSSRWYFKTL